MSQAKCLHAPRVMVPNGGKHKDGSAILQCKECIRQSKRQSRRRKMGYDEWFQRQRGLCAFCGLLLDPDSNRTHLDHNHRTDQKRGLVHAACNQMIGGIENAIALVGLDALVRYVS